MELKFDYWQNEYQVKLKGTLCHTASLGKDTFGNIQRIDNVLDDMEKQILSYREKLENTEAQLATAKVEVEKPFPQEDELKTKMARLDELNILLNLDKQENEIVDSEKGDENENPPPVRENSDQER